MLGAESAKILTESFTGLAEAAPVLRQMGHLWLQDPIIQRGRSQRISMAPKLRLKTPFVMSFVYSQSGLGPQCLFVLVYREALLFPQTVSRGSHIQLRTGTSQPVS